ncbi:MAG TPA: DUF692 domain-containing protein, partial [Spongiibacteraceae bacterium]
ADGGVQLDKLAQTRALYPLSLHGVGLSLGSTDPLDLDHLRKLKRLIAWSEPQLVSEHLAWGSVHGTFVNDLLPLPYTEEALNHLIQRVDAVQNYLGRQILIENVSSYLQFSGAQLHEWEFLAQLADASGCGLLVDINNVYVNAHNHNFDARHYLAALPSHHVKELHLAGHTHSRCGEHEILIDTHSTPVCDAVWDLYVHALRCYGAVPTLIEWDTELPALAVLIEEAAKAERLLEQHREFAA